SKALILEFTMILSTSLSACWVSSEHLCFSCWISICIGCVLLKQVALIYHTCFSLQHYLGSRRAFNATNRPKYLKGVYCGHRVSITSFPLQALSLWVTLVSE
uniref:Secreted protein n=1 Tax=Accipiter nisus TaxID=211598 RepID=A0A8B9MQK3_9AVES